MDTINEMPGYKIFNLHFTPASLNRQMSLLHKTVSINLREEARQLLNKVELVKKDTEVIEELITAFSYFKLEESGMKGFNQRKLYPQFFKALNRYHSAMQAFWGHWAIVSIDDIIFHYDQ